ncbi:hypothetical protein AB0H88_27725 [Nonomuraea sp. NPDC050680]|uniref:hypothetical protein n=1 Tax=Nonomuraea sp. NPDC050680 TaxID=3154630 RepID=UPI0033F6F6C4
MSRLRAALLTTAIAVMGVSVLSTPAQAADWVFIGVFTTKSKCIDMGQQYVREGFSKYDCTGSPGYYPLWVR